MVNRKTGYHVGQHLICFRGARVRRDKTHQGLYIPQGAGLHLHGFGAGKNITGGGGAVSLAGKAGLTRRDGGADTAGAIGVANGAGRIGARSRACKRDIGTFGAQALGAPGGRKFWPLW